MTKATNPISILLKSLFSFQFYIFLLRHTYTGFQRYQFNQQLQKKFPNTILSDDLHLNFPERVIIGEKSILSKGCSLDCGYPPHQGFIEMGSAVILGYNVCLFAGGGRIIIENNVDIGINCVLSAQSRRLTQNPIQDAKDFQHDFGEIKIGEGTLIASNVNILSGTTLGKYCNIVAGSVVQGIYPDHTTLVGNPARPIPRVKFNS